MGKTKAKAKPKTSPKTSQAKAKKAPKKKGKQYKHVSKYRCPRCRVIMRANGTRDDGRLKRWKCPAPVCGITTTTVGELV